MSEILNRLLIDAEPQGKKSARLLNRGIMSFCGYYTTVRAKKEDKIFWAGGKKRMTINKRPTSAPCSMRQKANDGKQAPNLCPLFYAAKSE